MSATWIVSLAMMASTGTRAPSCTNQKTCDAIALLASEGSPEVFAPSRPNVLCEGDWKTTTPPWVNDPNIQAYGSGDYQSISRSEFLKKNSYRILSADEKKKQLRDSKQIQREVTQMCCDGDKACSQAMAKVKINYCESDADRDPSKADDCELLDGEYQLDAQEQAALTLAMQLPLSMNLSAAQLTESEISGAQAALKGHPATGFPVTGTIQLSPYADKYGGLIQNDGVRHELGHACSFIKRQLATSGLGGASAARSFLDRSEGRCYLKREQTEDAYANVLPAATVKCLTDLAAKSTDESSSAFIINSCQTGKIEEATAEAFALMASPKPMPERACSREPSRIHPSSVDVYTCLLKTNKDVRDKLKARNGCA